MFQCYYVFLFGLGCLTVENVPKFFFFAFLPSSVINPGEQLPLLILLNAKVWSATLFFWLLQLQLSLRATLSLLLIQHTIIVSLGFSTGHWWWLQSNGADGSWSTKVATGNLCLKGQTPSVSFPHWKYCYCFIGLKFKESENKWGIYICCRPSREGLIKMR